MSSFSEFEAAAPELAARVRERLDAHVHKTIATLRHDGSPRICGTETRLADGELWIGSMWMALKALDLRRDPRFALHSGSDDPPGWRGDAKLTGRAVETRELELIERHNGAAAEGGRSHLFRLEIESAATVSLSADGKQLEIEVWDPGRGVRRIVRD